MATNIDTALTVQDAVNADHSPHVFTMSNGDLVAIYYDGTNLVWRRKTGGAWGASNTITLDTGVTPPQVSYLTRNGDVIFAIVSKDPIDASHNGDFFQFTYNTGTHTLATTNKQADVADGAEKAAGIGYTSGGSANNQVLALHGNAAGSFATIQQLNVNPTIFGTDQVPAMMDYRSSARTGVVTDGTTVNYLIYAIASSGTAFKVERFATSSATDNVETPPAPAANLLGVTGVWDGTNYVFIANEGGTKLRYLIRTGTNTYGAWTDILSDASLSGQPAVCVKSNGDLALFYRTNKNQANGEIWTVQRTSGTWGSPALLAGGATTGWSNPSCAASDLNDTGVARVLYVTGTASTWTLVEDALTFGGGGGTTVNGSGTLIANSAVAESGAQLVNTAAPVQANATLAETTAQIVNTSAPVVANSAIAEAAQIITHGLTLASNSGLSVTAQIITAADTLASNATLAETAQVVNPHVAIASNSVLAVTGHIETPPPELISNSALVVTAQIVTPAAPIVSNSAIVQHAQIITALVAVAANSVLVANGHVLGQTVLGTVTVADAATATASIGDALVSRATVGDAAIGTLVLSDT